MIPVVAHVAGVPVEELLLYFAPALLGGGAVAVLPVRASLARWRRPAARRTAR